MNNLGHALTVGKLKKALRRIPDNIPVYTRDHDHGTYETNGLASCAELLNQQKEGIEFIASASPSDDQSIFRIEGDYFVIGV